MFVVFRPELIWTLTAGSVAVVSEVCLLKMLPDARLGPHLADLGHAELRVGSEEELSGFYGEVVLLPVPEVLELLVVERGEGVHAGETRREEIHSRT